MINWTDTVTLGLYFGGMFGIVMLAYYTQKKQQTVPPLPSSPTVSQTSSTAPVPSTPEDDTNTTQNLAELMNQFENENQNRLVPGRVYMEEEDRTISPSQIDVTMESDNGVVSGDEGEERKVGSESKSKNRVVDEGEESESEEKERPGEVQMEVEESKKEK